MPAITLKALPTELHRTLKRRANLHKRSLNQEVIATLEEAVAPSRQVNVEDMITEARRFRETLRFKTTEAEINAFKKMGRA